jgi:hypothetical protein
MSDGEDQLPLIRTALRDRLPRGLSHPVGAEAISRALAGCPRYEELWTAFGSKALPLHPAPAGAADFRLAFTVVCNYHTDTWYLSVPAVPGDERAAARRVLLTVGLPGVREWLCRPRTETWHGGFRTFQVGYALRPLRALFVESLNHRVVGSQGAAVEGTGAEPDPAPDPAA